VSNDAKGPYTVEQDAESRQFVVKTPLGKCLYWSEYPGDCHRMAEQINVAHTSALTSQAARVEQLQKDLDRANQPWGATVVVPCPKWGSEQFECEVTDVGHAERVLLVKSDELDAKINAQAARVRELEEDREWLRSQWERHRKALNAIAWGEYDNATFCRRLAQDELAIGVKVANDRAAATVAALTPKEAT